jgi:hypothetical protein
VEEIQMSEFLVVLKPGKSSAAQDIRQQIKDEMKIMQSYGPDVFIVKALHKKLQSLTAYPEVIGVYEGQTPEDIVQGLDETGLLGVAAWNERHKPSFRAAKRERIGEGLPWDHPDFDAEG